MTMDETSARAAREAAQWLARLNQRQVSTVDLDAFYRWRSESAHAAAYARVEGLWRDSSELGGDPDIAAAVADALARPPRGALRDFFARIGHVPLIAGGLAALVVALMVWLLQPQVLETPVGEQRVVRLEDGTRVRLDTDTRLTVAFSDDARSLVLNRGRAFFEVAADKQRPFNVRVDGTDVRALGTAFDVRYDDDGVRIVLVEGRLVIGSGGKGAAPLVAGEQLSVAGGVIGMPYPADTAALTSWTRGRLTFNETRLEDAIAEVNRYTRAPIELDAESLRGVAMSGVFECGDVEAFVAAVTTLLPLRAARQDDGRIVLSS